MSLGKSKILIADDSNLVLKIVSNFLTKKNNFRVMTVNSGEECLEAARKWSPDMILLDVMMPGLTGFETLEQLQKSEKLKDIPVIFLSALNDTLDKVHGLKLGAVDYVTKPVKKEELLARVNTHLRVASLQKQVELARDEYMSMVHVICHDMGNYLTNIHGYSMLLDEMLEEESSNLKDYNDRVFQFAERAVQFLKNIREYEAVVNGSLSLNFFPTNLYKMVQDSCAVFEQKALDKKLVLDCSKVDQSVQVMVDYNWFVLSVLNNIMSNAVKFSYSGGTIRLRTEDEEKFVRLIIEDEGTGMKEAVLSQIFSSKSVSKEGTNGEKGTGFGMRLVKKWVEIFKGRVFVESRHESLYPEEHGTRFTITLRK